MILGEQAGGAEADIYALKRERNVGHRVLPETEKQHGQINRSPLGCREYHM